MNSKNLIKYTEDLMYNKDIGIKDRSIAKA